MAITNGPRVLIADDHAPTRAMIRRAVEAEGFVVCAEVADADAAIHGVHESSPDVIILDIRMPGGGIRAAEVVGTDKPQISIVMLTVSGEDDDLFSALSVGASGYLLKGQDPAKIPETLRSVLSGETVLSPVLVKNLVREYRVQDVRHRVRRQLPNVTRLTPREWEVLELLSDGYGTAEIGQRLFVADVTVRSHLASIAHKLKVKDRAGVLRLIRRQMGAGGSAPDAIGGRTATDGVRLPPVGRSGSHSSATSTYPTGDKVMG
jgi:DNA-binding NarL/FixJ family response regulator